MANLENIQLWAEALESGEYIQGDGWLHKDEKWCCLGVACDVARKNGLDLPSYLSEDEDQEYFGGDGDETDIDLPEEVQEWLGINSCDPTLGEFRATYLNDTVGAGFPEIASLIRREYGVERNLQDA